MKIATVVGARPQFIKLAPVSRALRNSGLTEFVIHTGQHYDDMMSGTFFEELGLAQPSCNLGIGSGPHGQQTGRMLEAIEAVLLRERPRRVLVYGDTNSTLAGALTAAKLHIPVAHVEAGARSFNRLMPEEINRIVTDHLSTQLFAASRTAVDNLRREGMAEGNIHFVGDVMFDAVRIFSEQAEKSSDVLRVLGLTGPYALATVHRAENTATAADVAALLSGLAALARVLPVVFPVHPRTRAQISEDVSSSFSRSGGRMCEPVGYFDMMMLERHASLVVTDSGGVQKEAFFHGVPCITLRNETEWTELVELGWNTLLPPSQVERLADVAREVLGSKGRTGSPYGEGDAAERIVSVLQAL